MSNPEKKETVVLAVYPDTRRRINVHASAKNMTQPEYIETIVPSVPGETNDKVE
jgi:hypothetical protein